MKEAQFYKKLKNKLVQCQLCPHLCAIKEGTTGKCKVRKNVNGVLYSLSYGKPISINLDPITKKPLYHFLPQTLTFSMGMAGCNLSCQWCQNWEISQKAAEEFKIEEISPEKLVEKALKSGCPSVSYTYTEPFISYEYVFDVAKLAKEHGLKNILVTNGFVNKEPFKKIAPYIDAVNIDLKGNDNFYKKLCGGKLQQVLDSIKRFQEHGIHVEITTLLIPGENDSDKDLEEIAKFIASLDKNLPWHISRFFPMYKMLDKNITQKDSLDRAYEIGKKYLNNVYLGNV